MLIFSVFIYIILTLVVGFYASKKVHNSGDFMNAGRNLHPAMNTAALFALWFGSETIFGATTEFAQHGVLGVIEDPFGAALCLILVGLFFARRLYKLNIYTIGDLFRKHYGQKIEMFSSALMILSFVGYAGAQIVALGLIGQTLFGLTLPISMLLSVSIVIFYTFTGGMWAVSVTDFLQSIFIVVGLVAVTWYVTDQLGSAQLVFNSLSSAQTRFLPDNNSTDWINWVSAWMALGFGSIASQDIFQRINSARSATSAYSSTISAAFLYLVFAMIPLYLITAVKIIDPAILSQDLQLALPSFVIKNMPLWVQVIFFGSLLSAIMSTCSGALLAPASLLAENIIKPLLKQKPDDATLLFYTRISVAFMGISSYLIALSSQNIFALVGEASVIGLVSVFVPFVAALYFEHTNGVSAAFSIVFGFTVYTIFRFFYVTDINPLMPGFLASLLGLGFGQIVSHLWHLNLHHPRKSTTE
jgi:SSS family transporter